VNKLGQLLAVVLVSGALGVLVAITISAIGCAPSTQQVAQKAAIQDDADKCEALGVALIRAAETCEEAVRSLQVLVKTDPRCKRSFPDADPGVHCKNVGTQPRKEP
jgi:hypothetical protein